MTLKRSTPTFVIHRERADGWRSTFDGGLVASTGAATFPDACAQAEATIRAELGAAYVACDHYAVSHKAESWVEKSQVRTAGGVSAVPSGMDSASRCPAC